MCILECLQLHHCVPYSNGLRGEVALGDHEVSGLVQFDNGPSVGLNFSFKGLMFLQLTLCNRHMIYKITGTYKNHHAVVRDYDK